MLILINIDIVVMVLDFIQVYNFHNQVFQELDDTTVTEEAKYPINVTR